ncbi:MAG: NAD(P)/FAD-dependent oxidoreductase [Actinomycetota bacterium]|nr:NAD(P)/FAD-dependent oxidoreductase [Actinomycetota bacterium]
MSSSWDCIVIGGGAAGLSAALVLGRARKRTLLVDAGHQCNLPASGIGGLLGHDGLPPSELYAKGRKELERYPDVEVRAGEATAAREGAAGFEVELEGGEAETAKRILLATGLDYGYPQIPGLEERWGRSVFHYPFCHGWEVSDRILGVLDAGASGPTRALLLRGWSERLTLYANGPAQFEQADAERLVTAGIAVDEREVREVRGQGDELAAIAFADGSEAPCEGLLVAPTLAQRSRLATDLGLRLSEDHPMVAGAIEVDSAYCTSVEHVFAAGDATGGMPSVANSVAGGSSAAAHIVHSLVQA